MLTWLEEEIVLAGEAMSQELGEGSVCTVHKDGRVTGGLKYQEGRMIALADVRRALVRGERETVALNVAEKRWSAEFERRRSSSPSSPMWVSYATGGLDAVRQARQHWATADPTGPCEN